MTIASPAGTFLFVTGSQHLYGDETLRQVAANARAVVDGLNVATACVRPVLCGPVVTTPDEVRRVLIDASSDDECLGVIAWMHTFSPAKMWIAGLKRLQKPMLHLHTQFDRDLPWSTIDMDYMNLHQSAHGGREFGHLCARMGVARTVVSGHWQSEEVHERVNVWSRAAIGKAELERLTVARIGDNMRQVAVTDGDKVEAQIQMGFAVDAYGVGDAVACVNDVEEAEVEALCAQCDEQYAVASELAPNAERRESLREAARIELGLRAFLERVGASAFTDTFEDLHGLEQLPGMAVQHLMRDGYGFGAEGDWKAAALLRSMKVMSEGLDGGTSFMEDYTYHLDPDGAAVLGAHMLEICPSIAGGQPSLEVHPLGIGGKADPVRLVFTAPAGPAVNASLVDMGDGFRMVVNRLDVIDPPEDLPKLPVARALWQPWPSVEMAADTWITAGGSHHPIFSQALGVEHVAALADMLDVECILTDEVMVG